MQTLLIVEDDRRLVPGTARIIDQKDGQYLVTAQTVEFGIIKVAV